MKADIGIIGGSGFYSLLEDAESLDVDTAYGRPSDKVAVGRISGRDVAFIPRHGSKHSIPPHRVPYRANIQAFQDLGVQRIIATNAVGSLKLEYKMGQIVAFDQFVNQTHGRDDTFFENEVAHISTANPYCTELRDLSKATARNMRLDYRDGASVVVINGPRFSTKAESLFFSRQGFDLINMTQYPEVALARERCICYLALGIVTDYDAGVAGREDIKPVSNREVMEIFSKNVDNVKRLVKEIVKDTPRARKCECANALDGAVIKM